MSEDQRKLMIVIGAGASGLPAVKTCLEENFRVICFERSDGVGGLWNYRPDVIEGQASVMKSTVINSSKEMSAYSDFPPPAELPNFMHNTFMLGYFQLYAQHFGLNEHIRFCHEVVSVTRSDDFAKSGRWRVRVRDLRSKKGDVEEEFLADGVMICTGHHGQPKMAKFPGLDVFKGRVIHSHSYRTPEGFDGQRVLVIGIGNSALDVATEVGTIAKQVYLSTRTGAWVTPRVSPTGLPVDTMLNTRLMSLMQRVFPFRLQCFMVEALISTRFNHRKYDIQPEHRVFSQHVTVNDFLMPRLAGGQVILKSNVQRFTEGGVVFEGDDQEYQVDVVVMATGYMMEPPPFLEKGVVTINGSQCELYKLILPPELHPPTLAFIGIIQPFGSIFPIAEMHSRWFMQVMTKHLKVPSKAGMLKETRERLRYQKKHFYTSPRHTTQVFYVPHMDDLAEDIGVKPNLRKLFWEDRKLFKACLLGPCYPYQYRLQGPHSCPAEARKFIMTAGKRMLQPLKTRTNGIKSAISKKVLRKKYFLDWNVLVMTFIAWVLFVLSVMRT